MPFDEDLRRQFESLTERIHDEMTRQLAIATGELTASAEAERAAAASEAAAGASAAAEQAVSARMTEAVAATERAAEARLIDAVAAAEQATADRLADAVAATERAAAARLIDAVAAAEQATADRLADAVAATERAAAARLIDAVAAAEQEAANRLADAVAATERAAAARLIDAVAAAEQATADRLADAVAATERAAAARLVDAVAAAEQATADRLAAAVAAAEDRGRVTGREDGRREGREEGLGDTRAEARAAERAAGERLVDAVRAIDRAGSLSEILDTLISLAGREAARVGVLLVRGGQLRAWRLIGFDGASDDGRTIALPLDEGGIIAEAVRTVKTTFADSRHVAMVPSFTQVPSGSQMLAVPIALGGEVVAVLYADQAADETATDGHPDPLVVWPAVLEVLTRHATRSLEATTAFRAAQLVAWGPERPTPRSDAAAQDALSAESVRVGREATKGDEDDAARRYARLLISEIKLYHEPEVIAGRRDRDVVSRLGGEIARARVLYEQRVPAHVRSATDHFHAELVRTLADGDPSLLGQTT